MTVWRKPEYDDSIAFYVLNSLQAVGAIAAAGSVGSLLAFHSYLLWFGRGTYDWLIYRWQQQDAKAQQRKLEERQRLEAERRARLEKERRDIEMQLAHEHPHDHAIAHEKASIPAVGYGGMGATAPRAVEAAHTSGYGGDPSSNQHHAALPMREAYVGDDDFDEENDSVDDDEPVHAVDGTGEFEVRGEVGDSPGDIVVKEGGFDNIQADDDRQRAGSHSNAGGYAVDLPESEHDEPEDRRNGIGLRAQMTQRPSTNTANSGSEGGHMSHSSEGDHAQMEKVVIPGIAQVDGVHTGPITARSIDVTSTNDLHHPDTAGIDIMGAGLGDGEGKESEEEEVDEHQPIELRDSAEAVDEMPSHTDAADSIQQPDESAENQPAADDEEGDGEARDVEEANDQDDEEDAREADGQDDGEAREDDNDQGNAQEADGQDEGGHADDQVEGEMEGEEDAENRNDEAGASGGDDAQSVEQIHAQEESVDEPE